jgi:hypothetical protein
MRAVTFSFLLFCSFPPVVVAAPKISFDVAKNDSLKPGTCVEVWACLFPQKKSPHYDMYRKRSELEPTMEQLGVQMATPTTSCTNQLLISGMRIANVKESAVNYGYSTVEIERSEIEEAHISGEAKLNLMTRQSYQGKELVQLKLSECLKENTKTKLLQPTGE